LPGTPRVKTATNAHRTHPEMVAIRSTGSGELGVSILPGWDRVALGSACPAHRQLHRLLPGHHHDTGSGGLHEDAGDQSIGGEFGLVECPVPTRAYIRRRVVAGNDVDADHRSAAINGDLPSLIASLPVGTTPSNI